MNNLEGLSRHYGCGVTNGVGVGIDIIEDTNSKYNELPIDYALTGYLLSLPGVEGHLDVSNTNTILEW